MSGLTVKALHRECRDNGLGIGKTTLYRKLRKVNDAA
jgi:Fe2+ or Zn2+ uptake regulation protein